MGRGTDDGCEVHHRRRAKWDGPHALQRHRHDRFVSFSFSVAIGVTFSTGLLPHTACILYLSTIAIVEDFTTQMLTLQQRTHRLDILKKRINNSQGKYDAHKFPKRCMHM